MENFAQRLKRLRIERKLTIKQMAEILVVSVSTYREWEYGSAIKGEPYPKIAEVLQVGLNELMTGKRGNKVNALEYLSKIEMQVLLLKKELEAFL